MNRRKTPNADWEAATDLRASTELANEWGEYRLQISIQEAEEMGWRPGDTLEFRQVDAAGNPSRGTFIRINAKAGFHDAQEPPLHVSESRDPERDSFLAELQARRDASVLPQRVQIVFHREPDETPPGFTPEAVLVTREHGKLTLRGSRAVEPGTTLVALPAYDHVVLRDRPRHAEIKYVSPDGNIDWKIPLSGPVNLYAYHSDEDMEIDELPARPRAVILPDDDKITSLDDE